MAEKGFYRKTVRSDIGAAIQGAEVTVNNTDGTPATVEDAQGAALSQPLVTDASGTFEFYALFGTYDITVTYSNQTVELPLQFIGPDPVIEPIGTVKLFATGVPLGNYLRLDGGLPPGDSYPSLAPLFPGGGQTLVDLNLDQAAPTSSTQGRGAYADELYMYAGYSTDDGVTVYSRADNSVVTRTLPNAPTGSVGSIVSDLTRFYIGTLADEILVYEKSGLSYVGTITVSSGVQVEGLDVDDSYLYVAVASGGGLFVYDKSTLALVQDLSSITGGNIAAVQVDGDRIYAAGNGFYVINKSTFTEVPASIGLPGTAYAMAQDEDRVYIGHADGGNLTVVDKTDLTAPVPGVPALGLTYGLGVAVNSSVIIVSGAGGNNYKMLDKATLTVVSTPLPALPGTGRESILVDGFWFVCHNEGGGFSGFDFSFGSIILPDVASPDPSLEYRIKAV